MMHLLNIGFRDRDDGIGGFFPLQGIQNCVLDDATHPFLWGVSGVGCTCKWETAERERARWDGWELKRVRISF